MFYGSNLYGSVLRHGLWARYLTRRRFPMRSVVVRVILFRLQMVLMEVP